MGTRSIPALFNDAPIVVRLQAHYRVVWWLCLILSSLPGINLIWRYYQQQLGTNPLNTLLHTTGEWALVMLIVTLSITPIRRLASRLSVWTHSRYGKRLSDWNWIIKMRRMLGLSCFAYACAHLFVYLHFDTGYDIQWLLDDLRERSFVGVGYAAVVLLLLLAITSTNGMIRRLGRHWRLLHRSVYAVAMLALIHYWWMVKPGNWEPLPETLLLGVLLIYRVFSAKGWLLKRSVDDGMEVSVRDKGLRPNTSRKRNTASSGADRDANIQKPLSQI